MVMAYMIQSSEHYNTRISEVEAQVMEISESLTVLRYNIKEVSDTLSYELDRLHGVLTEQNAYLQNVTEAIQRNNDGT